MNDCRKYEQFLFLYRKDELTRTEKGILDQHLASCSRCRKILGQLQEMDVSLSPLRDSTPELQNPAELIRLTIRKTTPDDQNGSSVNEGFADLLISWTGRSLGTALALLAILFCVQQSRDVLKEAALESRIRQEGSEAMSVSKAGMIPDPMELVRGGMLDLFRKNKSLAEEMSRKYPELAGVVISDGIDAGERRILETEGRAFMKDLEQLLQKEEGKP